MSFRIGIIQINVTDLSLAWRFYVDTLGIPGIERLGRGNAFELDLGNGGPTVLVYPVREIASRNYPYDAGVTLVLFTDDIRTTVREWTTKNVQFIPITWARDASGIADSPFGPFIAFRDPFGNVHELLEGRKQ
jgi:catechol 2,3-dioxygenase-like lactoylglutathione lyase family enzyme